MEEHQRTILAAQGYCELKMYEDALAELNALPMDVLHHPMTVEMRLVTLMQARRWEEALNAGLELCQLRPDASSGFIHSAFCYHELGRTEEAKNTLLAGPPVIRNEANFHYNLACYECVLGHLAAAREHLERSFTMDKQYREFAKTDPDLQGLRPGEERR